MKRIVGIKSKLNLDDADEAWSKSTKISVLLCVLTAFYTSKIFAILFPDILIEKQI